MFLSLLFIAFSVSFLQQGESKFLHAFSPGDIIIGGLFPVHAQTNRNTTHGPSDCSVYDIGSFLHSQVMIYAINEINQRTPRVLPNITIGYDIYDTCGDVSFAIRSTLQLIQSDPQSCLVPGNFQSPLTEPKAKVVIGERHSEVSIAVARVVALASVTQISYASTSELLSRKLKFPTFLRTISSDEYQTKAIVELVQKFNWKTVAIVGSDDEYGKYGSDNLLNIFRKVKDICIDFIEILPGYFSQNSDNTRKRLDKLVEDIEKSSAEAIILFTKESNVDIIMRAAIEHRLNRTWIASDSWSTSAKISTLNDIEMAGRVFGFISKRNEVPGFKDYVLSMFNQTSNAILEHYLSQYLPEDSGETDCSTKNPQSSKPKPNLSTLTSHIDQDQSYNIYLAVQVIAEGLRHLLKCDGQRCERSTNFTAQELLLEIKKVSFTVNTTHINFDSNGDPSLGYDIVSWDMDEPRIKTIGEYWPEGHVTVSDNLTLEMCSVIVTAYNCSKTCPRGQELKREKKRCCYHCAPCQEGEFSAEHGQKCEHCPLGEYSSPERTKCLKKTVEFLFWRDPFGIFLICLAVFGVIVVVVFVVLFYIYCSTPIVKAVGGYLCFLELLSLLVCFGLTFSFIGEPTKFSCKLGLPLFGIFCSLCISCILANLLQILLGFNFEVKSSSWVKKLNLPVAIVIIGSGVQLALCVPWLYFYPPKDTETQLERVILKQCTKGSLAFFIAMLSYNGLLAFICFLFAFKGKRLPDLYKNASLITTSMMLFLTIWIFFLPIYFNLVGKYKRAVECAAILIFSYSILGFHLAPKCYIMVFRKEINNEKAIMEYIRKHYEQKNITMVKS